ncbi:MAG TPA: hypothetical protein DEA78_06445 [Cyanobacteria bacterium UBA11159]|nr:hypothetical protein [Cyanobacteria bacterium UBA11159]
MNLQIYLPLLILLVPLTLLSFKGWEKREEVLLQFNLLKVLVGMNEETKCYALKEVLRLTQTRNLDLSNTAEYSSEKSELNLAIEQSYSKEDYEVRYSAIVSKEYAIAEIEESSNWVSRQKVWKGSVLQMVMFKKQSKGDFQPIYSCSKFLG